MPLDTRQISDKPADADKSPLRGRVMPPGRLFGFSVEVVVLLKQEFAGWTVGRQAMDLLVRFGRTLLSALAVSLFSDGAGAGAHSEKSGTAPAPAVDAARHVTVEMVEGAVDRIIGGDLARQAKREIQRGIGLCNHLVVSPYLVERHLRTMGVSPASVPHEAQEALAASVEYLLSEVLMIATNAARDGESMEVLPRHLVSVCGSDQELCCLCRKLDLKALQCPDSRSSASAGLNGNPADS